MFWFSWVVCLTALLDIFTINSAKIIKRSHFDRNLSNWKDDNIILKNEVTGHGKCWFFRYVVDAHVYSSNVYCLKHRSFDAIDISLTVGISTFCVLLPHECCCFFRCALDTFSAWNRTNSWINFQTQKFEFKIFNNMVFLIYLCKCVCMLFFKIQI